MNNNIIEFKNVSIDYKLRHVSLRAVNNVNFNIQAGKITALVGESGSGKSTLATGILNCISEPGVISEGQILFIDDDKIIDVGSLNAKQINNFRWEKVSMVFQGAQSALNPVVKIYDQFLETLKVHSDHKIKKEEADAIFKRSLGYVNLDAERVLESFPHELSGGMKQRVMIAFALLLEPKLVILDEPTTALDVITQEHIFSILKKINVDKKISMLLLTHDIGVVSKYADYVAVMYGGRIMEFGDTLSIFKYKMHPYTDGLISATPSLLKPIEEMKPIGGNPPNLLDMPKGCVFHPRCTHCMDICSKEEPQTLDIENHLIKCHLYKNADEFKKALKKKMEELINNGK